MKQTAIFLAMSLLASSLALADTNAPAAGSPSASVKVSVTPLSQPMNTATMAVAPKQAGPIIVPGVTPDANYTAEPQFSGWQHINLEEAKRLHAKRTTLFVDARAKVEWDQSHIPGAIPLPLGEFDKYYDQYKHKIHRAKVIVSYCHGAGCHLSDKVCEKLIEKGQHNVVGFFGGWPQWQQNGLPIEDKDGKKISNAATAAPTAVVTPVAVSHPASAQ